MFRMTVCVYFLRRPQTPPTDGGHRAGDGDLPAAHGGEEPGGGRDQQYLRRPGEGATAAQERPDH